MVAVSHMLRLFIVLALVAAAAGVDSSTKHEPRRLHNNRTNDLPQLGLPCWLQRWASTAGRKREPKTLGDGVLIVAFGLIRSIPMLHTTMQSLEKYAPVGARLTVRAFCRSSEVAAVHARLNRTNYFKREHRYSTP